MGSVHQLPGLLDFLLHGGNGSLILLAELEGGRHFGRIGHNLGIQLPALLGQALLRV